MTVVSWVLLGLLVMSVCFGILMHHAWTVSIEEREKWYTPLEPIKWDYDRSEEVIDAEVEDGD